VGAHLLLVGGEDHNLRTPLMSALRCLIYTIAASGSSNRAQPSASAKSRAAMIGAPRRLTTVAVTPFKRQTGVHMGWKL
jgi:hypothetical protein